MWTRRVKSMAVVLLWIASGQFPVPPAAWATSNYALQFAGGNTNSLQEEGDFVDLGHLLDVFPRGPKTLEFWCKVTHSTMSNMFLGIQDPTALSTRSYLDDNNSGGALTIGIEGAGAKGTVYIDDIRLYPKMPEYTTPVQPANTNLVAYYTFDEGSGTVAKDSSGNGNNGTINGNPQWVPGKIGGALSFDGTGDYVDCGKGSSLVIRDAITLSCWIKVAAFTRNWETILGMGDDSYRISRSATTGNSVHFGCNGPTGSNLNGNTSVTTDTWRHVAMVYDGAYRIVYIDGVEDARLAATGQINVSAYNLYIGANSQQANRNLQGTVDDVRIYSRPLSAAEVAGLAGQTKPVPTPF